MSAVTLEQLMAVMIDMQKEISSLRKEMHQEIGALRTEMGSLREEMHQEIGSLREEMAAQYGELHRKIDITMEEVASIREEMVTKAWWEEERHNDFRREVRSKFRLLSDRSITQEASIEEAHARIDRLIEEQASS